MGQELREFVGPAMAQFPETPSLQILQLRSFLPEPGDDILQSLDPITADMLRRIRNQLDSKVFQPLVASQSAAEFFSRSHTLFGTYFHLSVSAAAQIASISDPSNLVGASYTRLESSLTGRDSFFSEEQLEEVLFCLSTLHRASILAIGVASQPEIAAEPAEIDRRLVQSFIGSMFWSLLHLGCVQFAVREGLRIPEQLIRTILLGLRSALDAYSFVREMYGLNRFLEGTSERAIPLWDEEDQLLSDTSTFGRESTIPESN
jgi:hypothetical protein